MDSSANGPLHCAPLKQTLPAPSTPCAHDRGERLAQASRRFSASGGEVTQRRGRKQLRRAGLCAAPSHLPNLAHHVHRLTSAMVVSERFVKGLSPSGFHRLRYFEWGAPQADVVVCVHGLTRNAHDFDRLADRLADRYRVIAADMVGRGGSDWLTDPAHYTYAQYQGDMNALLARLDVERVHWIGTSMGGLTGMFLAALPGTPIASLLLNDVGPFIPAAALRRITGYLGDPRFSSLQELERHLRA